MVLADEQRNATTGALANLYWTLSDHLGSVKQIAERVGTAAPVLVNVRKYDVFGNLLTETAPAIDVMFGFTGREFDKDADLQYNRARWYDARQGRWTQEDPIREQAGDTNLYRYVGNSPADATDPSGLFFKKFFNWLKKNPIIGGIATAVVGALTGGLGLLAGATTLGGSLLSTGLGLLGAGLESVFNKTPVRSIETGVTLATGPGGRSSDDSPRTSSPPLTPDLYSAPPANTKGETPSYFEERSMVDDYPLISTPKAEFISQPDIDFDGSVWDPSIFQTYRPTPRWNPDVQFKIDTERLTSPATSPPPRQPEPSERTWGEYWASWGESTKNFGSDVSYVGQAVSSLWNESDSSANQALIDRYPGEVKSTAKGYFVNAPVNMVTGTYQAITHPIDTIQGIGSAIYNYDQTLTAMGDSLHDSWQTAEGRGEFFFNLTTTLLPAPKGINFLSGLKNTTLAARALKITNRFLDPDQIVAAGRWGDEVADLATTSTSTIDHAIGPFKEGALYGHEKLERLTRYLEKRGVTLIADDVTMYTKGKGNPGFSSIEPGKAEIYLPSNPTAYQVWHELAHARDWINLDHEAYRNLPRVKGNNVPEQNVYDMLRNSRRWDQLNNFERSHATDYIERLGGRSW